MNNYTWIVTKDDIDGQASDSIGKIGPPGPGERMRFDRVITAGQEFRLLTADGRVKFSGFILGDFQGHEPLVEYGREFGCASIQYRHGSNWVTCRGVELGQPTGIAHFRLQA